MSESKQCEDCSGEGVVTVTRFESAVEAYLTEDEPCDTCEATGSITATRYCAGCNELEGSPYAKHCCTPDNLIEA